MAEDEKKLVLSLECTHCTQFFTCNGKPDKNTDCVAFVEKERDDGDDGKI